MVEGGDILGLEMVVMVISVDMVVNLVGGLFMFIVSIMVIFIMVDINIVLFIVGMLLFINDGFVGLNSWLIF